MSISAYRSGRGRFVTSADDAYVNLPHRQSPLVEGDAFELSEDGTYVTVREAGWYDVEAAVEPFGNRPDTAERFLAIARPTGFGPHRHAEQLAVSA